MGSKRRPAPSILFSVKEAKSHDAEAFAALALGGLSAAALLEPKLLAFQELFEGPLRERELLSREENQLLDGKIHTLLLLLSPHLQARAAQECLEGLLQRCFGPVSWLKTLGGTMPTSGTWMTSWPRPCHTMTRRSSPSWCRACMWRASQDGLG